MKPSDQVAKASGSGQDHRITAPNSTNRKNRNLRTKAIWAHVCQLSSKEFGQIIPKVSLIWPLDQSPAHNDTDPAFWSVIGHTIVA
jgi:hypothetical protein